MQQPSAANRAQANESVKHAADRGPLPNCRFAAFAIAEVAGQQGGQGHGRPQQLRPRRQQGHAHRPAG